jgi:hypothetical protein
VAYLRLPEARATLDAIGLRAIARGVVGAAPHLLELARRTRRMRKPWAWNAAEAWRDRPLDELRAEFGIEVFDAA